MRPDGVYVMNIIDYPSFRFVRSELATLETQFKFVGAVSPPLTGLLRRQRGTGRVEPHALQQRLPVGAGG